MIELELQIINLVCLSQFQPLESRIHNILSPQFVKRLFQYMYIICVDVLVILYIYEIFNSSIGFRKN